MPSVCSNVVRGSVRVSGGDLVGIAEQEAQHVEVMDAHVGQRQPVIVFEEGLPVRDRVHVDLRRRRSRPARRVSRICLSTRIDWS